MLGSTCYGGNANTPTVTQLKLEHSPKKTMYDAKGFISLSITLANRDEARHNLLLSAQQDLERQHIDHNAALSVPPALDNLAATVSDNQDLLISLGTVMEKIQRISAITVDAVDALAKVRILLITPRTKTYSDSSFRSTHTPTRLGKS